MKKILAILLIAMLLGSAGMALADREEREKSESSMSTPAGPTGTAINKTQAESIALANVTERYGSGYAVVESELDHEKGNATWEVDLKNSTAEVKVVVDGTNGNVLSLKFEEKERELHEEREQEREGSMKFEEKDGSYDGRYTDFKLDKQILNYMVNGTLVFDSIEINAVPEEIKSRGAEIKIEFSDNVELDAHDNPTGLLKIDAENSTIKLVVASGLTITKTGNKTMELSKGSFNGTLMIAGKGELTVDGRNINATITEGKLIFKAKPGEDYGEQETHRHMEREIEEHNVGAEVHIKGKKSLDTVIYTDLSVNITNVDEKNKTINVVVNSPTPEGKFIIFNIDANVTGAIQSGGYKVLIDGKEIPMANNIQNLIDAKAKNETSKYLVTIGASGAQVIVYVQKFSEHTITISAGAPSTVPGFEAFGLLIAIAAAAVVLRKR